jgi:hypothetical protein
MGSMLSIGVVKTYIVEDVEASPETLWSTITDIETIPHFISAVKEVNVLGLTYKNLSRKNSYDEYSKASTCLSSKDFDDTNSSSFNCENDSEVNEGFAWEEIRRCALFGNELKVMKSVTSIGLIPGIDNTNSESLSTQFPGRRCQKYLRINTTLIRSHHFESETCTIMIDWDQDVKDNVPTGSNTTLADSETSSVSNANVSAPSSHRKKCQLSVTTAFIPNNILLRLSLLVGRYFRVQSKGNCMLQYEINEIRAEAEKRERQTSRLEK